MQLKNYIDKNSVLNLFKLALPVIASSFMSMAYNFINMIFVGRLGTDAVAAVGSAGFFMNLSWGISAILTVGAGIKVSHSVGEKNKEHARDYVRSGIQAIFVVSIIICILIILSSNHLIRLIDLNNTDLEKLATNYLQIISLSLLFLFQNLFFTSVFIGYGDSKTPLNINTKAFVVNILLDPVLIFVFDLGIYGAAIGTITSQALATLLFFKKLNQTQDLRPGGAKYKPEIIKNIISLGVSPTIQRVSFTLVAIGMARIISNWGATAIAVQKIGIQIEAISYMTAGGFMSAISSISGQAYGAKQYTQQLKVFYTGLCLALFIGIITSTLFIIFPEALFSLFLDDKESLTMGSEYLVILGFSQLFMCMELMSTGAFFGWGKTNIPAITSISLTALRIPLAFGLIHFWQHSLSSVWWSISISSIAKGTLLVILYIILFKTFVRKYYLSNYENN